MEKCDLMPCNGWLLIGCPVCRAPDERMATDKSLLRNYWLAIALMAAIWALLGLGTALV